ncbi:MAG: hypothetical protein ACXVXP_03585 [Mycobacteriaceae bacterium]
MGALAPPQQILDGVLTDPARVHAAAWQEMFDSHFMARAERENAPFIKGRVGQVDQLVAHGADTVVTDLADLMSHR